MTNKTLDFPFGFNENLSVVKSSTEGENMDPRRPAQNTPAAPAAANAAAPAAKPKRKRVAVDPNETQEAKLIRLASHRVNRILTHVKLLGNLGRLKPTEAQKTAVFEAIKASLEVSYAKWEGKGPEIQKFAMPAS